MCCIKRLYVHTTHFISISQQSTTYLVSVSDLCFISMISTMKRSIGSSCFLMAKMESTTAYNKSIIIKWIWFAEVKMLVTCSTKFRQFLDFNILQIDLLEYICKGLKSFIFLKIKFCHYLKNQTSLLLFY